MTSMTSMTPSVSAWIERSIARSLGKSACIYAYPLVELLRMCRLQTVSPFDLSQSGRAAINTLHHSIHAPTDRGIASRAASRLYTTAWIYLGDGPRHLHLPAGWLHLGHRVRATLYDAHTEKIAAFGWGESESLPVDLLLLAPRFSVPRALEGRTPLKSGTDLVYLVARIDVDESDKAGALALQSEITLQGRAEALKGRRPPAVDMWEGDDSDPFVDLIQRKAAPADVAPSFYANLCRALAHARARPEARHLVASFRQAGIVPGASLDWRGLPLAVQQGLAEGLKDAAECVWAGASTWQRNPQLTASEPRAHGRDYLARAVAFCKGGHLQAANDGSARPSLASTSRAILPATSMPA